MKSRELLLGHGHTHRKTGTPPLRQQQMGRNYKGEKETLFATATTKEIKQLTIYVQFLYQQNYKTLLRDIKEELTKCRDITCFWKGRLDIVKTSVLLKLIYKFNGIPIKIKKDIPEGHTPKC